MVTDTRPAYPNGFARHAYPYHAQYEFITRLAHEHNTEYNSACRNGDCPKIFPRNYSDNAAKHKGAPEDLRNTHHLLANTVTAYEYGWDGDDS